jgi:hypothetical protein
VKPFEPSGPIQLIPPGLLGLLQLKSPAGQNPAVLNSDVGGTIDLLPFYLRANRRVWALNSGITLAAGTYNTFTALSPNAIDCPQNQWWYVHSVTMTFTVGAASSYVMANLAMRWNSVGTIRWRVLGSPSRAGTLTSADGEIALLAEKFWMPPGSSLGVNVGIVAGAAGLAIDLRGMDYTILPI